MTTRRAPVDEIVDEIDRREGLEGARFRAPYTRVALEWIAVAGFAGVVASIVGVASAVVYWAWTA